MHSGVDSLSTRLDFIYQGGYTQIESWELVAILVKTVIGIIWYYVNTEKIMDKQI